MARFMRRLRHRQPRHRVNHSTRTLLFLGWMAATVGLTKAGLPDEWAVAIFFLGPIVIVAAPTLMRWMRSGTPRQPARKGIDWSVVGMASAVAIVGFFAALWWP